MFLTARKKLATVFKKKFFKKLNETIVFEFEKFKQINEANRKHEKEILNK